MRAKLAERAPAGKANQKPEQIHLKIYKSYDTLYIKMEQAFQLALIRPTFLPQTLPAEEPQEDILLPCVYRRPPQPNPTRGKIDTEKLIKKTKACYKKNNCAFEKLFAELQSEFQPMISWAISCWDYILTTEGVRFVPRNPFQRLFHRGYYRAFQQKDFARFVNAVFKKCLLEYNEELSCVSFIRFIKIKFWEYVLSSYRSLEIPEDRRQRHLTGYSYLRCIPYQFLNSYHHNRVKFLLQKLPIQQKKIINFYFLNFFTDEATAEESRITQRALKILKRNALYHIKRLDPLVYALLLQLERY